MNEELREKLKAAKFPFNWCDMNHSHTDTCSPMDIPSLEELIKACGDKFGGLMKQGNSWYAIDAQNLKEGKTIGVEGKTPTEVVAKLWLSLPTNE